MPLPPWVTSEHGETAAAAAAAQLVKQSASGVAITFKLMRIRWLRFSCVLDLSAIREGRNRKEREKGMQHVVCGTWAAGQKDVVADEGVYNLRNAFRQVQI